MDQIYRSVSIASKNVLNVAEICTSLDDVINNGFQMKLQISRKLYESPKVSEPFTACRIDLNMKPDRCIYPDNLCKQLYKVFGWISACDEFVLSFSMVQYLPHQSSVAVNLSGFPGGLFLHVVPSVLFCISSCCSLDVFMHLCQTVVSWLMLQIFASRVCIWIKFSTLKGVRIHLYLS